METITTEPTCGQLKCPVHRPDLGSEYALWIQILQEAARILANDGWTQGINRDGEGRRCMGGALGAARVRLTPGPEISFHSHMLNLNAFWAIYGTDMVTLNDNHLTSAEEAITVLSTIAGILHRHRESHHA